RHLHAYVRDQRHHVLRQRRPCLIGLARPFTLARCFVSIVKARLAYTHIPGEIGPRLDDHCLLYGVVGDFGFLGHALADLRSAFRVGRFRPSLLRPATPSRLAALAHTLLALRLHRVAAAPLECEERERPLTGSEVAPVEIFDLYEVDDFDLARTFAKALEFRFAARFDAGEVTVATVEDRSAVGGQDDRVPQPVRLDAGDK